MKRKDFLSLSLKAPAAMMAASCCFGAEGDNAALDAANKKIGFAQTWAKSLVQILDTQVDEPTRLKIMDAQGRACFSRSHGARPAEKPAPDALEKMLDGMRKWAGAQGVKREGNVIEVTLPVKDNRCFCPLTEKGPEGLSPTYCQCSAGYMREMFERSTAGPVKVQVLDSLKINGKPCRFRAELKA